MLECYQLQDVSVSETCEFECIRLINGVLQGGFGSLEKSFIFRELQRASNYFKGAGDQAETFASRKLAHAINRYFQL